jgi:hypothetical protein
VADGLSMRSTEQSGGARINERHVTIAAVVVNESHSEAQSQHNISTLASAT